MDNLSHTLTGLILSRAGLNRWTPHATAIMLLAANAPDVDVVSAAGGSLAYLDYHRAHTHALFFAPLMAIAAILPVMLVARKTKWSIHWRGAFAAALVGVGSHLLLDWTNVYGVRLFLPFSAEWVRLDITHIIDVWIWAILLLGVLAPLLSKLVSSEIGAKSGSGRAAAISVLLALGGYEYGRYLLHVRAVATVDSRMYYGAAPLRSFAFPGAVGLFSWTGLVQGSGYYVVVPVNLLREFDPTAGRLYYQAEPGPALTAAKQTEVFRRFLTFTQVPLWRASPAPAPEGATRVSVTDLRFGSPQEERFAATAVVLGSKVLRSEFQLRPFKATKRE